MEPQLSRILNFIADRAGNTGASLSIYSKHTHYQQHLFHERIHKMANENLKGKKVAILVTDGFEQVELLQPREALDKAGAETKVVSLKEGP